MRKIVCLVFLLLVTLPDLTASQSDNLEISATAVGFPVKSLDLAYTLRVSGPDGKIHEERFPAGSAPSFSLYDVRGEVRHDGTYVWELITLAPPRVRGQDRPVTPIPAVSGAFSIQSGGFVAGGEEPAASSPGAASGVPFKDQVIADDLIVQGSECLGLDCVNGETFNADTLRLKENNLRIHFDDTSTAASFPRNDWRIVINDTVNGGPSFFAIEDATAVRQPFRVDAAAPADSLRVSNAGRLGVRTAAPALDIHVASGNTPALRLEQNGSSGFTPQTWDVAGNETNFFIRDVNNGSRLPFRIQPNAPSSSVFIAGPTGNVGVGTSSPTNSVHVRRSDGTAQVLVEEASVTETARTLLTLRNNGNVRMELVDSSETEVWILQTTASGSELVIRETTAGGNQLRLLNNGNLIITGSLTTAMNTLPDYVFETDYPLMPLDRLAVFVAENKHLPGIPSAADVRSAGNRVDMSEMQRLLLEKVEELTLYTLAQEKALAEKDDRIAALGERLARLEAVLGTPAAE